MVSSRWDAWLDEKGAVADKVPRDILRGYLILLIMFSFLVMFVLGAILSLEVVVIVSMIIDAVSG